MQSAICVAELMGLGMGVFTAASADVFPALRSRLNGWGSGVLVGSVALLAVVIAII